MIAPEEIEKLRRLGLTELTSAGLEAVRVTAQNRRRIGGKSRESLRTMLQAWETELDHKLMRHGGEVVVGSLSIAGQTVEAVVPIVELDSVSEEMIEADVRLDLVLPRKFLGTD